MTTRRKEAGTTPGKEKRGTSPSTVGSGTAAAAAGRRSPGPSPKTSDSGKSIPSYLKPTATSLSSTEATKLQSAVKRKPSPSPSPSLTSDKATIERRRSFDKPPSPSRSLKSPASPSPPTLRSSSFSGKISNDPGGAIKPSLARRRSFDKPPSPSRSTRSPVSPSPISFSSGRTSATLNKGVSERNLKGPKDAGKPQSLYARPASTVKKSSVLTKKSEAGSDSSRKKRVASSPEKVENPDVPKPEQPQSDEQESFAVEEEEPEYNLLEDQDVNNIIEQIEGETHDNDAVIESPTVIEQHDASVESPTAEENQEDKVAPDEPCTDLEHEDEEDKSRDEEMSNEQEEDTKEETTNEMNHTDDNDESGAGEGDPNEEVENKEREEEEEDENEEAIQVDNESESKSDDQLEEKQVEEVVVEEKKEEEEGATPRVAHGKKDVALSNDVIEETRNKLTEQRRNRVKALAGAFETVISLQDPK